MRRTKALEQTQGEVGAAAGPLGERGLGQGRCEPWRGLGNVHDHVENSPPVKQAREELEGVAPSSPTPDAEVSTEDLDKLQAAYELYIGVLKPSEKSKAALDEVMPKASGMVSAGAKKSRP